MVQKPENERRRGEREEKRDGSETAALKSEAISFGTGLLTTRRYEARKVDERRTN